VLYICIPVYNEEQTVGVVLWKIRQVMTEFRRDYQIIVGDDASTDSTPAVLAPYARVLPLTILRNPERRGYAASLEMLLREAVARSPYPRRDVVVTLQADFTDDPADLVALVKQTEAGADIVTGNVQLPEGTARSRRWARTAAGWVARRMNWPDGAGDALSNYRAYRVSTLTRAFEEAKDQRLLSCDGWAANVQLLQAAAPHARRVESVELTERHERLQRETRFDGWTSFRHVLALARGRAPRPAEVASIAPSESRLSRDGIHIDAASVNDVAAAHRSQGTRRDNGASATRAPAKGNGRGDRNAGRGGERRDRSSNVDRVTRDRGVRAEAGTVERRRRTEKPGRGAERQGRRGGRAPDDGPAATTAGQAAETNVAAEESASPPSTAAEQVAGAGQAASADDGTVRRRRRSRRGGRRRRGANAEATGDAAQPDATSGEESAGEDSAGATEGGEEEPGERPKRRRSRRGSRGGRRRRGGAAAEGAEGAAGEAGAPDGGGIPTGGAEQSDGGEAYQDGAEARRQAS
jgi:hypothetical protein